MLRLKCEQQPTALFHARAEFAEWPSAEQVAARCPNSNYLKGVRWAPDGCCLLAAAEDGWLRVFDLPQSALDCEPQGAESLPTGLRVEEGELIYDYAWYPAFRAAEPASCCFLTSCRAHPIHLWDACGGGIRASYRAYDAVDEVTAAYSVAFNSEGSKIYAGYNKAIRVFDTTRPGRFYKTVTTQAKKLEGGGLRGIVSCLAFSPQNNDLFAAGTYSREIGIFGADIDALQLVLRGHRGGVTQIQFSPDGNYLYSGARKDGEIICWDVRFTPGPVYRLQRGTANTNQRIQFDIEPCGRHLGTGQEDGRIQLYDLTTGEATSEVQVGSDTVNGFQFHPSLPFVATASGHRRYLLAPDTDDSSSGGEDDGKASDGGGWLAPATSRRTRKVPRAAAHKQDPTANSLQIWRYAYEHCDMGGAEACAEEDAAGGEAAMTGLAMQH
eukprot:jgi/Tetstr1/421975/TSEL_001221.t1